MQTQLLALNPPLRDAHEAELRRRVFYLAESIVDFALRHQDGEIVGVQVTTDQPVAGLESKLQSMVDQEIRPQLTGSPKVVWRSPVPSPEWKTDFDDLARQNVVSEIAPGQVALNQPAIDALDAIDRALVSLVTKRFGGEQRRYPTLIPMSALHRSGYLASFPQHMMFATRLRGDVDTYRAFSATARGCVDGGLSSAEVLDNCSTVTSCLPPTMCYHTFNQLRDQRLDNPAMVITARGGAFRHEARYHRTLERLSDFTIREVVFLGSSSFVRQARESFRMASLELVTSLGLSGRCEVANDPFFAGGDNATQVTSQRLLELKYELALDIGPGKSIAAGSFNLHDRHFGETFNIRGADGEIAHTACVGFGLERFTYAFLCQYGTDVADWPASLRLSSKG